MSWQAGAAKVSIVPSGRSWLAGYGHRDSACEAGQVLLPIYARVLVLKDATGEILVWGVVDLVGTSWEMTRSYQERVSSDHQVPPKHILLSATHTHR